MATRTSVGSGLWSAAGTWDTGVPANNDTVVIAAGHTVTFDVDQSGFADGIAGLTITGTLKVSITTSSYMKMKAAAIISGAGTFNIGESSAPIPFAVKFTLTGSTGWRINGASGLVVTCYAAEPSIKYVNTVNAESIGDTVLEVGTDVTSDIWADGDLVYIVQKTRGGSFSTWQKKTIAVGGIAAGSITLSSALTANFTADSYVVLITRNVFIDMSIANNDAIYNFTQADKIYIAGGLWKGNTSTNYRVFSSSDKRVNILGGVFYEGYDYFGGVEYFTFSDCVFAANFRAQYTAFNSTLTNVLVFGNSYSAIQLGVGCTVTNCTVVGVQYGLWVNSGLLTGCTAINCSIQAILNSLFSTFIDCSAINSQVAFSSSNHHSVVINFTYSGNTNNIYCSYGAVFFNTSVGTPVKLDYTGLLSYPTESFDEGGVAGAYKAWTSGGETELQTSVLPSGFAVGFKTTLASTAGGYLGYFKKSLVVPAGKSATIHVALRKTASMSYLPRVYLALLGSNPEFITPVDSFTMTDSIDTWETDSFTIDNTSDYDKTYQL